MCNRPAHFIHQLMVEMWHIQFLQASTSLSDVTRTKVLPQQQFHLNNNMKIANSKTQYCDYLVDQVHNWSLASTNTPDVIKSSQAMLHTQQQLGTHQGLPIK